MHILTSCFFAYLTDKIGFLVFSMEKNEDMTAIGVLSLKFLMLKN